MSRFSGKKQFQQEIFSRNVCELKSLLHALELQEVFEEDENRPKTDLYETCSEVIVEFDLPGVHPEDIVLKVLGQTLVLEAFKNRDAGEGSFVCVERRYGRFHHAINIPCNVEPDSIRAEYRSGVLRVACNKAGERRVPIKEIKS